MFVSLDAVAHFSVREKQARRNAKSGKKTGKKSFEIKVISLLFLRFTFEPRHVIAQYFCIGAHG
ncbi:MAG: hypothetical protein KDH99_07075 [Alcanivoracaceae bacterium]|nr:hypothetical protein [Alcanivoracaceae bacterium]